MVKSEQFTVDSRFPLLLLSSQVALVRSSFFLPFLPGPLLYQFPLRDLDSAGARYLFQVTQVGPNPFFPSNGGVFAGLFFPCPGVGSFQMVLFGPPAATWKAGSNPRVAFDVLLPFESTGW